MSPHKLLLPIIVTIATLLAPLLLCAELRAGEPCGKVCEATIEEVTEEKSRWNVGCKEICVPRVVCPWADGGTGITTFNFMKNTVSSGGCNEPECFENLPTDCIYCEAPRCGDVRYVRTLDSEPYETRRSVAMWDTTNNCFGSAAGGYAGECGASEGLEAIDVPTATPTRRAPVDVPTPQAAKKFYEFWK